MWIGRLVEGQQKVEHTSPRCLRSKHVRSTIPSFVLPSLNMTFLPDPDFLCRSIPADRPRRTNKFHKSNGTLDEDGFVELERAAFLNAAYLKQKANLHLLRKKLNAERKLKRRNRRKSENEKLKMMLNEKQVLIDKLQKRLLRNKKRLAKQKTLSAANNPSLQALNTRNGRHSRNERRNQRPRLPNPRQHSTIPPHEFYGAGEPPSREEGRYTPQSPGAQATLTGDEVGVKVRKSNFAVIIPQPPPRVERRPGTNANAPELRDIPISGGMVATEPNNTLPLSTADLRRESIRKYNAARKLRQPKLSEDVPLAERKTDEELVQIGKLPSPYARHQEAPYAFVRSGRIRSSYRRLLESKTAAGNSVWTERELRSICKIPKGVRLDAFHGSKCIQCRWFLERSCCWFFWHSRCGHIVWRRWIFYGTLHKKSPPEIDRISSFS